MPGFEGNLTTTVGSYLEDLVAQLFEQETGKKVRREKATIVNDAYPFACADLDRVLVGEKAFLEIKTTNSLPAMKKIRGGEFPEQWWCQVVHYMAVGEYDKGYLAVLVNCRELKIFELERDEAEIKALMDAEAAFWENVKNDTPPAVDGSEATAEALTTIYGDSAPGTVELFGREQLIDEYETIKRQLKALGERRDEIENVLKTDLGDNERGLCGRWTVSWKTQTRQTLNAKALQAAHPEYDLAPYYKTTAVRPFKITEKKN